MDFKQARVLASTAAVVVLAALTGCGTSQLSRERSCSGGLHPAKPAPRSLDRTVPFRIGNSIVRAEVFQRGQPAPTMINVHDDEDTSVTAGKLVLAQTGGRLIELVHGGKRHVAFGLGATTFRFDPNRVYSEAGIRASLTRQGAWSEAAHGAVRSFARQYLKRFGLDREPVIIALHNTMKGTYSVRSYLPGAEHASAAVAVHVSERRDQFDFFYVTDARFFEWLRQRDFNVVLQDNARVPDDGSLSVYFARQGVPYMNIEAQAGRLDTQVEMVRAARAMVAELGLLERHQAGCRWRGGVPSSATNAVGELAHASAASRVGAEMHPRLTSGHESVDHRLWLRR